MIFCSRTLYIFRYQYEKYHHEIFSSCKCLKWKNHIENIFFINTSYEIFLEIRVLDGLVTTFIWWIINFVLKHFITYYVMIHVYSNLINYLKFTNSISAKFFHYLFVVLYETRYNQNICNYYWYYISSIIDPFTLSQDSNVNLV